MWSLSRDRPTSQSRPEPCKHPALLEFSRQEEEEAQEEAQSWAPQRGADVCRRRTGAVWFQLRWGATCKQWTVSKNWTLVSCLLWFLILFYVSSEHPHCQCWRIRGSFPPSPALNGTATLSLMENGHPALCKTLLLCPFSYLQKYKLHNSKQRIVWAEEFEKCFVLTSGLSPSPHHPKVTQSW